MIIRVARERKKRTADRVCGAFFFSRFRRASSSNLRCPHHSNGSLVSTQRTYTWRRAVPCRAASQICTNLNILRLRCLCRRVWYVRFERKTMPEPNMETSQWDKKYVICMAFYYFSDSPDLSSSPRGMNRNRHNWIYATDGTLDKSHVLSAYSLHISDIVQSLFCQQWARGEQWIFCFYFSFVCV